MINKAINKENTMLCYQCGETADVTGCTARGACGKTDDIAGLKDELLAETEKLAFVAIWLRDEGKATGQRISNLIMMNLFVTVTNEKYDYESIRKRIGSTEKETMYLMTLSGDRRNLGLALKRCGKAVYKSEEAASLHSLIVSGIKGMAACVHYGRTLGESNRDIDEFIQATLADLYECRLPSAELFELAKITVQLRLEAMEMIEENYGLKAPLI